MFNVFLFDSEFSTEASERLGFLLEGRLA